MAFRGLGDGNIRGESCIDVTDDGALALDVDNIVAGRREPREL